MEEGRGFLPAPIPEISWISCGHAENFCNCFFSRPEEFSALSQCKVTTYSRAWKQCSAQNKGKLFQAHNRKITMIYSENKYF